MRKRRASIFTSAKCPTEGEPPAARNGETALPLLALLIDVRKHNRFDPIHDRRIHVTLYSRSTIYTEMFHKHRECFLSRRYVSLSFPVAKFRNISQRCSKNATRECRLQTYKHRYSLLTKETVRFHSRRSPVERVSDVS